MAVVAPGRVGFCVAFANPPGPVHEYEPPPVELSCIVCPTQYGPVFAAVATGPGLIVTVVVDETVHPPPNVATTVYVPAMAVVTPGRVGFCNALVNAPGPVQLYVAPPTAVVVRLSVAPAHNGPLFPAVKGGGGDCVTVTVLVDWQLSASVMVTVYVPAASPVTVLAPGAFIVEELYPEGPAHE